MNILEADNFGRSRFSVLRDNQPYMVAFDKSFAVSAVTALKARGFHATMYEGLERPSKRSYENAPRVVLPSIKAAPQRRHSASSTVVHYWGEQGRLPVDTLTYLVESYDVRHKTWLTVSSHEYLSVAESVRKRHERIRVIYGDKVYGFKTVQILHNDPRLPVA